MFGAPPSCRPECVINQDCPSNRACIRQRCEDPCVGTCGFNALCTTQNHQPKCSCLESYQGDPYTGCNMIESEYTFLDYLLSLPSARSNFCDPLKSATIAFLMLYVLFSGVQKGLDLRALWFTHFMHVFCIVYISNHHSFIYVYPAHRLKSKKKGKRQHQFIQNLSVWYKVLISYESWDIGRKIGYTSKQNAKNRKETYKFFDWGRKIKIMTLRYVVEIEAT